MTPVGIFSLGAGEDSGIFTGFFESLLWDCAGNLAAMNRPGDSCVSTGDKNCSAAERILCESFQFILCDVTSWFSGGELHE